MIDLNKYQNLAAETAFYPGRNSNLPCNANHGELLKCTPIPFPGYVYTVLGLMGEVGEMSSAISDFYNACSIPEEEYKDAVSKARLNLEKEMGDVFWYLSQFCMELGIPFSQIHIEKTYYSGSLRITEIFGEICELTKKAIRDNGGKITPTTKEKILNNLRHIFDHLMFVAKNTEIFIDTVLEKNIEKLSSRRERNALGGSGDNR